MSEEVIVHPCPGLGERQRAISENTSPDGALAIVFIIVACCLLGWLRQVFFLIQGGAKSFCVCVSFSWFSTSSLVFLGSLPLVRLERRTSFNPFKD
jgi:hypothetical protein